MDIQNNQTAIKGKRGGARPGSGPKSLEYHIRNDAKYLSGRGINPLVASEILARVIDERKIWKRILATEDDRVLLQAMMFLTTMRDGKPAQSVNITSQNINYQLKDIDAARAIIREIRGEVPIALSNSPLTVDAHALPAMATAQGIASSSGEEKANEPNLCFEEPKGESK